MAESSYEPSQSIAISISDRVAIRWDDLTISYSRSSGPGGQNVNKVNTKVRVRWDPGNLPTGPRERFLERYRSQILADGKVAVASQEFRDQRRNLEACLQKLAEMVQLVLTAPKKRRPTKPTRGSIERRLRDKQSRAQRKQERRPPVD